MQNQRKEGISLISSHRTEAQEQKSNPANWNDVRPSKVTKKPRDNTNDDNEIIKELFEDNKNQLQQHE